ncbi:MULTISPECIES: hypothetical protein [unclassified Novosphingobium]|uniref:hypothetical protein n=1 Tax=unclassified Novosphingobium TaxID=2644732 RepID=UPI000EC391C0|nr:MULTISPECIES: hypothetical protein [unclassified Novosphingobium]HCF25109.1 hypothetical protein [Novosphingobium sp.]HQV02271.1 hypothetical protein [Novosphingobium sp.]
MAASPPADPNFDPDRLRAIRSALARKAYETDEVRIADPDLTGAEWLVASPRGVFAVGDGAARLAIHGWFFGICRDGDALYLFENCGLRDRWSGLGRLLKLRIAEGQLGAPQVLAKGLDGNCHQVRMIDGLVCLVDTANQAVLRFNPAGRPIDNRQLFPHADIQDSSGAYLHINSIARIGGRLAVLLHNGKARPARPSEIAWLDDDWRVTERMPLEGHACHDLATDPAGRTWYCASMSGEIASLDGTRLTIDTERMTRGIAFSRDRMAVGVSTFGPREARDGLRGTLVVLGPDLFPRERIELDGPPTDLIAL